MRAIDLKHLSLAVLVICYGLDSGSDGTCIGIIGRARDCSRPFDIAFRALRSQRTHKLVAACNRCTLTYREEQPTEHVRTRELVVVVYFQNLSIKCLTLFNQLSLAVSI